MDVILLDINMEEVSGFDTEEVVAAGEPVRLKAMEWKLLAYLVKNRRRVVTKEELFSHVWGDSITGDGTLNVHIRRLREKLEAHPDEPVNSYYSRHYRFYQPYFAEH